MLFERSHRPLGTVLRSSPVVQFQIWRDARFASRPLKAAAVTAGLVLLVGVLLTVVEESIAVLPSAWLMLTVAVGAVIGGWRVGIFGSMLASIALWIIVLTPSLSFRVEDPAAGWGVVQFFVAGCALSLTLGAMDRAVRETRKAATALERSEQQAQNIARRLQRTLLPNAPPAIPGLEVAARYLPADASEVGGDFYDWYQASDNRWYLQIGDVCGKGPAAASRALLARYTLRTAAMLNGNPIGMLQALNTAILAEGDERYCTAAVMRFDLNGHASADLALGGHPQALLIRDDRVERFGHAGSLVGLFEDVEFGCATSDLRPGDRLVLYTDGVTDYPGAPLEDDDLHAMLVELNKLALNQFAGEFEHRLLSRPGSRDDIAFVLVGVTDDDA